MKILYGISCALALIILTQAPANACFSIIVGKDASTTGEILLGHNEDNDRRIVMAQYFVPRMTHKKGALITMEPKAAKIPQVPETYAYYWTQTLSPDGYSFSDGFINEWGVAIVSDNCISSKEKKPLIKEGGVGYGIRRIMAERAKTAREAVHIAIDLLNKYGYFHPGRSYQIVDKDEAWMLQVVRGNRYVARRIADDEIALIANAYTIDKVNLKDKNNVIASPDLITYAISKGWYKPAKKDNYADFNFRKAYQDDDNRNDDFNKLRHATALKILTGKDYEDPSLFPFVIKPENKISLTEVKEILRGHYAEEPRMNGYFHQNMNDICNISTQESVIIQIRKDPRLIAAWRATGRPCTSPYVPIYPLAGVPYGQNWMDPVTAQKQHFNWNPSNFDYNYMRAVWSFLKLQNYLNYRYDKVPEVQEIISELEIQWDSKQETVEKVAAFKFATAKPWQALDHLYNYANDEAIITRSYMKDVFDEMNVYNFAINAKKLSKSDNKTVATVLYSTPDFDATKIEREKTFLGVALSDGDDNLFTDFAKPIKFEAKDMNNDKLPDMVMTYKIADVMKMTFPGVNTDIYLRTYQNGNKIITFDTVTATK